jgi:hypothetical protein
MIISFLPNILSLFYCIGLFICTRWLWSLWWHGWSRYGTTSWEVMGSIPDGVIDIILPAALGSARPPVHKADNLATCMYWSPRNSGSLNLLQPYGHLQACKGITVPLPDYCFICSVWSDFSCKLSENTSKQWWWFIKTNLALKSWVEASPLC